MAQEVKFYTQSQLFSLANQIRKSTGCSQKEAYHKAKNQLEMNEDKSFNLSKALSGSEVKTKNGNKVKVICVTGNKILVKVFSNIGFYYDREIKYNLDGSRWSSSYKCNEDLVMA